MTARKSPKSLLESAVTKGRYAANNLEFLELPNIGNGNNLVTISCEFGTITVVDLKDNLLEFSPTNNKAAFKVLKKVKDAKLFCAVDGDVISIRFPLKSIHQVAKIAIAERNPES